MSATSTTRERSRGPGATAMEAPSSWATLLAVFARRTALSARVSGYVLKLRSSRGVATLRAKQEPRSATHRGLYQLLAGQGPPADWLPPAKGGNIPKRPRGAGCGHSVSFAEGGGACCSPSLES